MKKILFTFALIATVGLEAKKTERTWVRLVNHLGDEQTDPRTVVIIGEGTAGDNIQFAEPHSVAPAVIFPKGVTPKITITGKITSGGFGGIPAQYDRPVVCSGGDPVVPIGQDSFINVYWEPTAENDKLEPNQKKVICTVQPWDWQE